MDEHARDRAARLRREMVGRQIAARGVADPRVLAAFEAVERHRFVPEATLEDAYADRPIAIGFEQTISQPFIVAAMLERLHIRPGDRVLDVGTGSGYQAALLAELGADVDSIEVIPELFASARQRLPRVRCHLGDGALGWPERAPFDAIVLAAAPAALPAPLLAQLAIGGRLVAPIGVDRQQLEQFTREADGVRREPLYPVRFVPMTRPDSAREDDPREWT